MSPHMESVCGKCTKCTELGMIWKKIFGSFHVFKSCFKCQGTLQIEQFFFSVKGQIVNIVSFVIHIVCVTTIQLYLCGKKAVIDNTSAKGCDCIPRKQFIKRAMQQIWQPPL